MVSTMTEEEFRIRLNVKKPVTIFEMEVRQYTLDEILDVIGYKNFNYMRNFVNLTTDSLDKKVADDIDEYLFNIKEQLMIQYSGVGYDFDYTLFDMCGYVPFINSMFVEFLTTFTIHSDIEVSHVPVFDEMIIRYDGSKNLVLSREQFDEFMDMFSILNYSVKVDRNFVKDSEAVKEFDDRAKEIKEQFGWQERQEVTLESITSALIDSDNSSYNHENICDKTIYQILNSFNRMCKLKDNEFMNLIRVNCTSIKEDDIKKSTWYYNIY